MEPVVAKVEVYSPFPASYYEVQFRGEMYVVLRGECVLRCSDDQKRVDLSSWFPIGKHKSLYDAAAQFAKGLSMAHDAREAQLKEVCFDEAPLGWRSVEGGPVWPAAV